MRESGHVHPTIQDPSAAEALPGRAEAMPVPERALRAEHAASWAPSPASGRSSSAWVASGERRSSSGRSPACPRSRRRLLGWTHAQPDLSVRSARDRTGHTEAVLVVYEPGADRPRCPAQGVLGIARSRRRACGRGTTPVPDTRSAIYAGDADDLRLAEATSEAFQNRARRGGSSTRSPPRSSPPAPSITRRIPPAVPREESRRLLRSGRHGCGVPDRGGRQSSPMSRMLSMSARPLW